MRLSWGESQKAWHKVIFQKFTVFGCSLFGCLLYASWFFRFCDESCNTIACGYDAGDCGVSHFSRLYEIAFNYNASNAAFKLVIPKSIAIAYVNVSKVRVFHFFVLTTTGGDLNTRHLGWDSPKLNQSKSFTGTFPMQNFAGRGNCDCRTWWSSAQNSGNINHLIGWITSLVLKWLSEYWTF